MRDAAFADPSCAVPVTTLLRSTAREMAALSEMSDRLHDLVARQMNCDIVHEQSLEEAQSIDLLVQHLQTIGGFLDLLADQLPPSLTADFASMRNRLPLAALAYRLSGDVSPDELTETGDLDLF